MDLTFRRHEFLEGESFDYLYESTEAVFATEQVSDGRVPRITDLVQIDESRTNLRFSIVLDGGMLRKRVDFTDTRFRAITNDDLERREQVPFRSGQDLVPGLPDVMTHTYDLGTDGQVASGMGVIFDQYLGDSEFRGPFRFIDAFTFPSVIESFSESMCVGEVRTRPVREVEFYGRVYHSARQTLYFDRIDMVDGIHHAFVKLHALGNFTDRLHGESSYLMSAHVPLEGPTAGLVSRGELHEIILSGDDPGVPVSARQRQLSMTMQTEHTQTGVLGA